MSASATAATWSGSPRNTATSVRTAPWLSVSRVR